jgi:phosphohistidine phosphatase SixA
MTTARVFLITAYATFLQAQDAKPTILEIYSSTLRTMRTAQTKEDISRMMDAIDVREWTSSLFNGQTMTRAQAMRELESLLSIPLEKRPSFRSTRSIGAKQPRP